MQNQDSPSFKNEVSAHIQARLISVFEKAGFTREKEFAIIDKPMLQCKSFLVIGDQIHDDYCINVSVKSLDCSIRIVAVNRHTNKFLDIFYQHPPLRFKIGTSTPTEKSEQIIQEAITCLEKALKLEGKPKDWMHPEFSLKTSADI